MFDEQRWTSAIKRNITRDSNLKILPDGTLGGSFETELKHILGIDEDDRSNNNIGFVKDVLDEYYRGRCEPIKQVSFEDEHRQFGIEIRGGSEDLLLRTVKQILGLVNLTSQSIEPPIKYFLNPLLTDLSDTYYRDGGIKLSRIPDNNIKLETDREHAASVIAKMFSAGLGDDGLLGHFSEEIDTTVAAKQTKDDMTREMLSDTMSAMRTQLSISKQSMKNVTEEERALWNTSLEDLFASFGVLLTHLNHDQEYLDIKKFMI
jgi:hypothetical protein